MSSGKQVNSEQTRREPSTDEEAYDALDGKAHFVDIYYLMKGGESFTTRELCNEIEKGYQTTSTYLNKMEDRGVVTYEMDGRTKIWFLDKPFAHYNPETIIEQRTVVEEKEVSPYRELEDFLFENTAHRALLFAGVAWFIFGGLLLVYKYALYDFYPTAIGTLPETVTISAVVCLSTILVIAYNEVNSEW